MSRDAFRSLAELDRTVRRNDAPYVLAEAGSLRLVIATGGVFVVAFAKGDPGKGHEVAVAARSTRDAIAAHLTYVPFVEAIVVDNDGVVPHDEVSVVPADLLEPTFAGHSVRPDVVAMLTVLLHAGQLGPWRAVDPPGDPARQVIDLDAMTPETH